MNQMVLMEEITRKMAETFQNIHRICLEKIKELENYNPPIPSLKKQELSQINSEMISESPHNIPPTENQKIKPKKQKIKDPNKPKLPLTSFFRFCRDQREIILKDMPNQPHSQITKIASKCWKELSEAQKQPYHKRYLAQKQKYDLEMEKYLKENPEVVTSKKQKKTDKKAKKDQKQKSSTNEIKPQETPKPPQATQNQKQESIERFFNNANDDSFDNKI